MEAFGTYGVVDESVPLTPVGQIVEEISRTGFCVIEDAISQAHVEALNVAMEEIYQHQCHDVGGEQALIKMNDADIVRCPLAYSELYMKLALNPRLLEPAKALLGDNVVLIMQNGIMNRPGRVQYQTRWHRDLNFQHWVCTKPLAISVLVCLEEFSAVTGGTVVLPYSHRFPEFPSQDFVARHELTVQAKSGSAVLFDSMLFHRSGVNTSGKVRRAVNHVIGVPILNQQVNIPAMLHSAAPDDPWTASYLGYRWQAVRDVADWRRRRIRAETAA
jgi:ectoine hydroxylase-related dioxygenase (phytanoyl-CoA dioxygenase family)